MRIYVCDDTVEGIFTAIYRAWEYGTSKTAVEIRNMRTPDLFSEYVEVVTDYAIAFSVADSIKKKISEQVYYDVVLAALSQEDNKAQVIYRFLIKGFRAGRTIKSYMADKDVMNFFEIIRRVNYEALRYIEIVRFEECNKDVLIARISPRHNIISTLESHFSDRLHCENWIILDTKRNIAIIHPKNSTSSIVNGITEKELMEHYDITKKEHDMQLMWKKFFDTIAIKERTNLRLQQNHIPLYERKYMTEFNLTDV